MQAEHRLSDRGWRRDLIVLLLSPILLLTLSNLVRNDAAPLAQDGGIVERVSVASDGTQAEDSSDDPAISSNGRYVAFRSYADDLVSNDTNGEQDVFLHDRQTGQTRRVSVASDGTEGDANLGEYDRPAVSADGRYVAFVSLAGNLVSGDTNTNADVFVHDVQTGMTTLVSQAADGSLGDDDSEQPALSADGRYVAFSSRAALVGQQRLRTGES